MTLRELEKIVNNLQNEVANLTKNMESHTSMNHVDADKVSRILTDIDYIENDRTLKFTRHNGNEISVKTVNSKPLDTINALQNNTDSSAPECMGLFDEEEAIIDIETVKEYLDIKLTTNKVFKFIKTTTMEIHDLLNSDNYCNGDNPTPVKTSLIYNTAVVWDLLSPCNTIPATILIDIPDIKSLLIDMIEGNIIPTTVGINQLLGEIWINQSLEDKCIDLSIFITNILERAMYSRMHIIITYLLKLYSIPCNDSTVRLVGGTECVSKFKGNLIEMINESLPC